MQLSSTRTVLLLLCAVSSAWGQLDRGTITGLVTDPSGAAIAGARITAVHLETNIASSTNSTRTGNYTLPSLLIGSYRVEVEAAGFKRAVRDQVVLTAGSTLRLDIPLEVGSVSESIEVSAKATSLETESASVATNITNQLVDGLPLMVAGQIRNVFNLAIIAPEAKTANQFRIGGGQGAGWDMLMDGSSLASASANYQTQRAPLSSVPIDAIREFTVESNGMKAEYGRSMGIISFATKSGTNRYHGDAFEFLRNDAFDARGFFAQKKPILKQHDFGGTFGGPLRLPRLYNGKDKTFFFFSYEGFRSREGNSPTFNTIPLAAMYDGDFSGWVNGAGAMIPLYDPASTRPDATGKSFIRDPFPNNRIPVDRFSQVARNYLSVRPKDMIPNRPGSILNYYRQNGGFTHPWNKGSARIDHRLTQKDTLSFLFLRAQWQDLFLNDVPPGLPIPFNGAQTWSRKNTSARFSWDRTITARILNSLRVAGQAEAGDLFDPQSIDVNGKWSQRLGVKNITEVDRGVPQISMTDYTTWASTTGWAFDRGKDFSLSDDLSVVSGSHTLKTGFFFSRDRWDGGGQNNPGFSFSFLATALPGDQSRNTGNAFASFLLGYPGNATLNTPRLVAQIWRYVGGYFQDDWRVNPKLILNLGLRYEYTYAVIGGAQLNEKLAGFSNFSPTTPNPGAGGISGAMIFSGHGPNQTGKDSMFDGWPWAFSPRLGIAYSVRPGTVIRTSGGRSFEALKTTGRSTHFDGFIGSFSWSSSDLQINDSPTLLDRGLPPWNKPPFLRPDVSNGQASIDYWLTDQAGRPSEFWNWTFDIQQQLPGNSVLSIGYTGTRGLHLTSGLMNINQIDPRYLTALGPALLRSNINSAAARVAGIPIPYASFNGTVQQALQPFPQYKSINTYNGGEKIGSSAYHALVLKFDKRYSSGLTLLGSYVLSKMFSNAESASLQQRVPVDNYNRKLERSLSADDQTHVGRVALSYELPLARGAHGATSRLLGGWSAGAYLEYGSGTPMSVSPGVNPPIYPGPGGNRVFITSYDNWRAPISSDKFDPFKDQWWNGAAFQQVPKELLDAALGNATRFNPKARSAPILTENVSLLKNLPLGESRKLQLRVEAFNLFNRVRWASPDSTYTSPTFGLVRSQVNDPREIQLGCKLYF